MANNNVSLNWTVPTFPIVVEPPVVIYPTESVPAEYSYDVYSYIIVVFVLISILGITKVAINRKQSLARQAALRDTRARQGQGSVPTVSGSVDASSITSSDPPSTSQSDTDAHVKVDLPPTYDEVMKTFLEAKEAAAAASPESSTCAATITSAHEIDAVDIEDPPPPQYSNIQSP